MVGGHFGAVVVVVVVAAVVVVIVVFVVLLLLLPFLLLLTYAHPLTRALYGYEGNSNTLTLVGSGSGGVEELKSHLEDDRILYGILQQYYQLAHRFPFPLLCYRSFASDRLLRRYCEYEVRIHRLGW